ncbi:Phosphatidylcholine-sterol acyltransferase [Fragariocoptes setiger]|uniref:Phosphatidylcholine-sterol acyltransferase n=1 Tax=Fragariocoptes setiger TaxID=1670756 RepID=A0ABQ7SAU2_9ACAR|nr:Phosphatidylcholine-sterol acyltransferase [Fragariocoptes setiger]
MRMAAMSSITLTCSIVVLFVCISRLQLIDCATIFGGLQWQHQQTITPASLTPMVCNGQHIDYNLILKNKNMIDENCQAYRAFNQTIDMIDIPALCLYIEDMNLLINKNFDCETALTSTGQNSLLHINDIAKDDDNNSMIKKKAIKGTRGGSVILIPGLAGSRLQAKLNNVEKINFLCSRNSDWTDVWLRISMLLPLKVDCWINNIILEYDPATGTTHDQPGVTIKAPDFGSVKSVKHLDLGHANRSEYFSAIIDRLEEIGYETDRTILAAPYDFRKAPNEIADYFMKLDELVERAVAFGYGHPTTLVCHSMGCLYALVYLREKSPKWRLLHIKRLLALASPWGGSTKAAKALVAGDGMNIPLVSENKFREVVRSFPSVPFLLTNPNAISNNRSSRAKDHVIIQRPSKNYTIFDYEQLFQDLNLPNVRDMWLASNKLVKPFEPIKDLRVDCIHGSDVPTIERVRYLQDQDFPDGPYELDYDSNGDGTVNWLSLTLCSKWQAQMPELIRHFVVPGVGHTEVLHNDNVLDYITTAMLEEL